MDKGVETRERDIPVEFLSISPSLEIVALPLEHRVADIPQYRERLESLISQCDGVIGEFDPDELRKLAQNPLAVFSTGLPSRLEYFNEIKNLTLKQRKDYWAVDPAYSAEFVKLRTTHLLTALTTLFSSLAIGVAANKEKKISRRRFLEGTTLVVGSGVLYSMFGVFQDTFFGKSPPHPNPFLIEQGFRRIVVAKALKQLGKDLKPVDTRPQKFLLIYPPSHWDGIKRLAQDPSLDKVFDAIYRTVSIDQSAADAFFKIRKTSPVLNGNTAYQEIPIRSSTSV